MTAAAPQSSSPPTQPPGLVAVLGTGVVDRGTPVIHADDLGFTRGDGCFDATRVQRVDEGYVVNHRQGHLDRFERSAARLGLSVDRNAWERLIDDALAAWDGPGPTGEAMLKLMLSGGPEATGEPLGILTLLPISPAVLRAREGVSAVTLAKNVSSSGFTDAPWLLGSVKTLSYALNRAAYREAARRGADEAIWTSIENHLLEAPTSTVVVRRGDTLTTPDPEPTGVLGSVTQNELFDAAPGAGLTPGYGNLTEADVMSADGTWLVSAVRGVTPLLALNDVPVPHDPAGTVLLRGLAGF